MFAANPKRQADRARSVMETRVAEKAARRAALVATPGRMASMGPATTTAAPKTEPQRNPHLLTMARDQSCLLRVPDVCNGDRSTTVAAHSNLGIHGKAGARKADDQYHVHACSACHAWLDQGPAPASKKVEHFMRGHMWMVEIWRGVAYGFIDGTPRDRAAAQWALDRLNATPTFDLENAP